MKAIVINYSDRKISLSSSFEKKAFIPGTTEYEQLMSVRKDFPDFELVTRKFKTNTKQDRYKGLTYDYMRQYIMKTEKENAPAVIDGLEYLINISKCHSTSKRYPTVKKWFLERYPDVKKFGMTEEELAKYHEAQEKADSQSNNNVTDFPVATGTDN